MVILRAHKDLESTLTISINGIIILSSSQPIKCEEIENVQPARKKVCTSNKSAFSLNGGIGQDILAWHCTTCGGGENDKEARQTGNLIIEFLKTIETD